MKKYIYIFLFFISSFNVYSQESSKIPEINRYFNEVSDSLLRNDKNLSYLEIISKGDSLYNSSINDWQRVKSLFVTIQGYKMQLNWNDALEYALKADSITQKKNITYFKPRTNAILGSVYGNLGLYNKSFEYLDKAFQYCDKLDRKDMLINKSLINQRKSAVYHKQKEYKKALSTNLKALNLIENLKKEFPEDNYASAYIPVLINLGVNYYNLEEYSFSKIYYQKAFKEIINNNHNYYLTYLYIKYAATEIKLNNSDSAFIYIQKAKELSDKINDNNLKSDIDIILNEYYTSKNDFKSADSIKTKIIENYQNLTKSKSIATQNIVNQRENQIQGEKRISTIAIIISIILVIGLSTLYIYHKYQNKKIKRHFNKIIEEFQNKSLSEIESSSQEKEKERKITNEKRISLSEKKVTELMEKLENFENSAEFTTKNFTISNMALLLNTNTKYINYILQEYRGKNFNDYLNEIRIKYIVQKMINNPEYLNYKIDYLSEISGYSSHSRFTQMFKKEIKMSPSQFISQLNDSKKDKEKEIDYQYNKQ